MTSTAAAIARGKATFRTEEKTYRNTPTLRPIEALLKRARQIWPSKIAVELAQRAGVSVRSAENWLAGDRSISGDALIALLSSDKGVAFLDAIVETMPDVAQRRWRAEFERAAERADVRRRQDELDRRHAALGDEGVSTTPAR